MIFSIPTQDATTAVAFSPGASIEAYLKSRKISIVSTEADNEKYTSKTLADYAESFACLQMKGADTFLTYLRGQIVQKKYHCCFDLQGLDPGVRTACIDMANLLCSIGCLTNASENNMLRGNFHFSPRLVNFLNGGFLEIAIYALAHRILTEQGGDFELLPNVITESESGRREYDLLVRKEDQFFVLELKSGKFEEFSRYRERGKALGLFPHHQMLIVADRTVDEIKLISYFQEFHISTFDGFKENFLSMIA